MNRWTRAFRLRNENASGTTPAIVRRNLRRIAARPYPCLNHIIHAGRRSNPAVAKAQALLSGTARNVVFGTTKIYDLPVDHCRSSQGSFDNVSVIKSQSSLMGQTSMESNADESFARDEVYQSHSPTNGGVDAGGASENGASGAPASLQSKQKRNRPLMRQERVTKKEGEKDGVASGLDSIRSTSPVIHNFQPILPK